MHMSWRHDEDEHMTRRSRWPALGFAVCLAAAGAVVAYLLAGGPWAAAGAAVGAVTGGFAPSVYDGLRERGARHDAWEGTVENPLPRSWARLLDPRREVVGFLGRDEELAALVAWCEDDHSCGLRLVTGPGGVGKTRLAVELADRMRELGWKTERVADGREAGAISALREVSGGRALMVVDYAEVRAGLNQLLTELAGQQGGGVRVLLLARSAGDWWDQLGIGEPAVWDLVQAARPATMELPAVVAAELPDAEVIALAVRSFAQALSLPEKTVEIQGGTGCRHVLDLHAAALVAVLGEASAQTAQIDIGQVLVELLRHEQHFWYDSGRVSGLGDGQDGTTPRVLRQIIAAACLLGAATEDEARALPGRVPGMSPSAKVAEWLRVLYPPDPGETDWIGSLQPDRLAELHALRELGASPQLARACLTGLDARQALRAVTLLARASSDYPEAEELLRQTLPGVAGLIAGMPAPAETLTVIFNAIPFPTVILAPAAVAICERIVRLLPADTEPAVRAYWLENLGVMFSALGRPADALPVTEEAVAVYRELATASPDRYRPDLARSLSNLGVRFSELGRPADALPVTEEAVAVFRELATASPDRYRPDLANSLNNLGVRFSALGRPADALPVTEEAVAVFRELAAASPDRYRPDLAASLDNLGVRFSALGRPADALPPAEEAVAVYRELATASPDRYRPDLAQSLSNLGVMFSELGRPADALPPAEEAVAVYRELATASPDRYRPDLARSLTNLAEALMALDRIADADAAHDEAARLVRQPDR
jgi:tetratricopeptide (TPR) repeat protein